MLYTESKVPKKVPLGTGTDTGTVPFQMWTVPNPNVMVLYILYISVYAVLQICMPFPKSQFKFHLNQLLTLKYDCLVIHIFWIHNYEMSNSTCRAH